MSPTAAAETHSRIGFLGRFISRAHTVSVLQVNGSTVPLQYQRSGGHMTEPLPVSAPQVLRGTNYNRRRTCALCRCCNSQRRRGSSTRKRPSVRASLVLSQRTASEQTTRGEGVKGAEKTEKIKKRRTAPNSGDTRHTHDTRTDHDTQRYIQGCTVQGGQSIAIDGEGGGGEALPMRAPRTRPAASSARWSPPPPLPSTTVAQNR